MPQQQHYQGDDGWAKICAYLDAIPEGKVLLLTGQAAYHNSGAEQNLAPYLAGRGYTHIYDFQTNPKIEDVSRLLSQLDDKHDYQAIIAVGGGSVIDVSKLLKAFWGNAATVESYFNGDDKLSPCALPLIAVPSTAGSGSEATRFAVVYKDKEKFSIEHDRLLPEFSVVIPSLLTSVPPHVAASSGMDALCQGIESYWSIHSTEESRRLAKESIELAWISLHKAVIEKEPEALAQLARASHLAGQAINITKTTAPHAVSYALTTFHGIPHGHAVGLLTSYFLQYNALVTQADCLDSRGAIWVKQSIHEIVKILGCHSAEQAASAITQLMEDLGLETNFKNLGIQTEQDITQIVDNGFNPQRINNNPRRVTREALYQVFR